MPYATPVVYAGMAACGAVLAWLIPWVIIVTRANIKEQEQDHD